MIKRNLQKELIDASSNMSVISISGPRQSGKTTLARNTFPSYKYVNLENPDQRLLALQDPRSFLNKANNKNLIIDEVQHAPDLFSYIQLALRQI